VFGSKLMWRQLPELHALATELPEYAGLEPGELVTRMFDNPAYVWMTRRDKVRQAVSMWRALQTRSWRAGHGRDEPVELHYRYEGIDHLVDGLETDDAEWCEFFTRQATEPLVIGYEDDLERDRERTIGAVLEWIGVSAPGDWRAAEPTQRQADALSDEWAAAYHRDRTLRGPRANVAAAAAR